MMSRMLGFLGASTHYDDCRDTVFAFCGGVEHGNGFIAFEFAHDGACTLVPLYSDTDFRYGIFAGCGLWRCWRARVNEEASCARAPQATRCSSGGMTEALLRLQGDPGDDRRALSFDGDSCSYPAGTWRRCETVRDGAVAAVPPEWMLPWLLLHWCRGYMESTARRLVGRGWQKLAAVGSSWRRVKASCRLTNAAAVESSIPSSLLGPPVLGPPVLGPPRLLRSSCV